jgi:hypothetical protein
MKTIIALTIALFFFGCNVEHKEAVGMIHDMKIVIPAWDSCVAKKDSIPILNRKASTYYVTCHPYPGDEDKMWIGSSRLNHSWATGFIHDMRIILPKWNQCLGIDNMPTLHQSNNVHYIICRERPGE